MSNKELLDESVESPTGIRRHFRLSVRIACLIAAVVCLLPIGDRDILMLLPPSFSSFVALCSLLATKTIRPILVIGLTGGFVAVFRYRWFCRWACPMGLCLDGASWFGRHLKRRPCQAMSIGRWLCALTLGGALFGYPLFLWCDPLALLAGFFLLTEGGALLGGAISLSFVTLLVILSILRPHIWCRGVCPLGGFQDLAAMLSRSVRSIPRPATDSSSRNTGKHRVARRTILGLLAGAACSSILRLTRRRGSQPLRPPGAVEEFTFEGLCTRCGTCIRSCPYDIIRRDTGQHGFGGLLTPVLSFEKDYCREDCTRCTLLCPSGALAEVAAESKPDIHIGLAKVDMSLCLLGEDHECSACMRWCPYNAIRYVFSEAEYTLAPVISIDKCNGCGAGEAACPTSPLKAMRVFRDAKG